MAVRLPPFESQPRFVARGERWPIGVSCHPARDGSLGPHGSGRMSAITSDLRDQFRACDPLDRLGRLAIALLVVCGQAMQTADLDKRHADVAAINAIRSPMPMGWLDSYMQASDVAARQGTGIPDALRDKFTAQFWSIGIAWADVRDIAGKAKDALCALEGGS